MNITQKELGKVGEDKAVDHLLKEGYQIIERNYHYGKGEIDIIAVDPESEYTVFIEVKTRSNLLFGDPVFGVTKNKVSQLRKLAEAYLYDKNISELSCRFDVITILMEDDKTPLLTHYVNAFN